MEVFVSHIYSILLYWFAMCSLPPTELLVLIQVLFSLSMKSQGSSGMSRDQLYPPVWRWSRYAKRWDSSTYTPHQLPISDVSVNHWERWLLGLKSLNKDEVSHAWLLVLWVASRQEALFNGSSNFAGIRSIWRVGRNCWAHLLPL